MSERAKDLAERLRTFNDEVTAFVEKCTEENWRKVCAWEDWTVGVVARHIGAGHYHALGLARMIVNGEKLPELTEEQIIQMANQHASENADCTRTEVLEVLRKNWEDVLQFVTGLQDAELDRTGYLALMGADVSTQELIETVILRSGGEHFANMKAATDM